MKKQIAILSLCLCTSLIYSQGGSDNWKTGGNIPQAGSFFGTTNNFPINFRVNNQQKMVLDAQGDLSMTNLAGTGSRVLMTDANGKLISLPAGNIGQFLQADGTWGNLPGGATSWSLNGSNLISTNSGNIGIGNSNPQYKLDVLGSMRISNDLYVGGGIITSQTVNATVKINAGDVLVGNNLNVSGSTSMSGSLTLASMIGGTGNYQLLINSNGQLLKGPKKDPVECVPNAPQWYMGGNNVLPIISQPSPVVQYADIGTCDNADFILKSNDSLRQWIKPDGTIGFGTGVSSNSGGPEYRFKKGALRLQSMNSFGGPQIVWDGGASPFGDWGIEYLSSNNSTKAGLNFWKPFGSPYSANYLFFIADDGRIAVGDTTNSTSARFNVDAWDGNAIKTITKGNNNQKSLSLNLKDQSNNLIETFSVKANGYTEVNIFDQGAEDAFAVKDANSIANFKVKKNGTAYAREFYVMTGPFPDYVFNSNYDLMKLDKLKAYIQSNHHLPNMPTAKEVQANGLNLGEQSRLQVEKIEELTLYVIQLKEELEQLKKEVRGNEKK